MFPSGWLVAKVTVAILCNHSSLRQPCQYKLTFSTNHTDALKKEGGKNTFCSIDLSNLSQIQNLCLICWFKWDVGFIHIVDICRSSNTKFSFCVCVSEHTCACRRLCVCICKEIQAKAECGWRVFYQMFRPSLILCVQEGQEAGRLLL